MSTHNQIAKRPPLTAYQRRSIVNAGGNPNIFTKSYTGHLYDADPKCQHEVVALWSGVKCRRCSGWYCA